MSESLTFTIDGEAVEARAGQTIIEAADAAGVYIPRLCHKPELHPWGSCRVCTVMVNGRPMAACTTPAAPGILVQNETEEVLAMRRDIVEMLFVEGNHFCMSCEKSGNCELQAMAYRFRITAPRFEYFWPVREVDASHADVLIDHNRCILCARCARTSSDVDKKHVFGFTGRGPAKQLAVNSASRLGATDLSADDEAISACPVGALLRKRVGFATPVGRRLYDHEPIGSDIQTNATAAKK